MSNNGPSDDDLLPPDKRLRTDGDTQPMESADPLPSRLVLGRRQTKPEVSFYFSSKSRSQALRTYDAFELEQFPKGEVTCCWIAIVKTAWGSNVKVPVMVARGGSEGPVVGLTAALHGNEVSGIPLVQKIFHDLCPYVGALKGTIVAVACCNEHGFANNTRFYQDGADLNRQFPGKPTGTRSQQFCYYFAKRIISKLDYLIDLHTASFGRVNSFYVRANMMDPAIAKMARLVRPQIIVHNKGQGGDGGSGTLRGHAMKLGVKAICIEIGNPNAFMDDLIRMCYLGVARVIHDLGMIEIPEVFLDDGRPEPVICKKSYWIHTKTGGVLVVAPPVGERIRKDDFVASVVDIFGFLCDEYFAPEDGVVVGKSTNPANFQGDRILHLGIVADADSFHDDGTIKDV